MRQTLIVLTAAMALALPATALAADGIPNASQTCKTLRTSMGTGPFEGAYGTNANKSNAFGKCVSKMSSAQSADLKGSNTKCKTEQADANFAATHGGKTFEQFYGTNKNGNNAFGKCVSAKATEADQARTKTIVNASKTCKAERKSNPDAFKQKYGTNKNKSNAFGKCVSAQAKAQS